MTTEDIDVVRTVMSLVDKSSRNQDADIEDARRCMAQLLDEVNLNICYLPSTIFIE